MTYLTVQGTGITVLLNGYVRYVIYQFYMLCPLLQPPLSIGKSTINPSEIGVIETNLAIPNWGTTLRNFAIFCQTSKWQFYWNIDEYVF